MGGVINGLFIYLFKKIRKCIHTTLTLSPIIED